MKTTLIILSLALTLTGSARTIENFNSGWTFTKDGKSTTVALPHDWAIAGPFNPDEPGGTGKLPWRGSAVYSKNLVLEKKPAGRVYLEFDGVMSRATVFVNGQPCGKGEYGYLGFRADATPYLYAGTNLVTVACDTHKHHSRWYPGAGIYRDVRLVKTDDAHLLADDLKLVTRDVLTDHATLSVSGAVLNRRADKVPFALVAILTDDAGKVHAIAKGDGSAESFDRGTFDLTLKPGKVTPWTLTPQPALYTLELQLSGPGFADTLVRKVGFREFRFDGQKGFILNGQRVQLNGVDLHSDLGPLGMAFDKDAMRRQFSIMRDMGANALRTSHNAPAPQLLDLCDKMGFFVWDECFDKWDGTCGRGDEPLEEFVDRHLTAFVRRDRNHPCVFAWSIGNEIPLGKKNEPTGTTRERCGRFRRTILKEDTTRPVGIGSCFGEAVVKRGDHDPLDITGWNYKRQYHFEHAKRPDHGVVYTESASALSEFGFYPAELPTCKTNWAVKVLKVDSYDMDSAPWSDIADWEFCRMEEDRFCAGEFVWTGIDYLGEPHPFDRHRQPVNHNQARSSYFGICDLCALPKDRFYLYRSHWNRESFTLHIAPDHWNFTDRAAQTVFVYSSADEAELFLNGRSLGRRQKQKNLTLNTNDYYAVMSRYRLIWKDVPCEPGELKAVAYGTGGEVLGTKILHTAGEPTQIVLTPEKVYGSLCVVKVTLADKNGVPVPNDNRRISFSVKGGEIRAVGNSNPYGYDSFKDVASHPLHYGRAAVYLGLGDKPATLTATAPGLAPASVSVK